MRLFVAVDLGDALRARVGALVKSVRRRFDDRSGHARVAWVPPERLHLTLQFIGELTDSVATEVTRRLASPIVQKPFRLTLGGIGLFPPSGRARVAWLAVNEGRAGLTALHEEVVRRLEGVHFRRDARPFVPHLTVARFRAPLNKEGRQAFDDGARAGVTGRCTIDHITLYRSKLSPRGPTYTALQLTPLRRPENDA